MIVTIAELCTAIATFGYNILRLSMSQHQVKDVFLSTHINTDFNSQTPILSDPNRKKASLERLPEYIQVERKSSQTEAKTHIDRDNY